MAVFVFETETTQQVPVEAPAQKRVRKVMELPAQAVELHPLSVADYWIAYSKEQIASEPDVSFFVEINGREVDFWIVIPKYDLARIRELVVRSNKVLGELDDMPDGSEDEPGYEFDYHIVPADSADISEVVPSAAIPVL